MRLEHRATENTRRHQTMEDGAWKDGGSEAWPFLTEPRATLSSGSLSGFQIPFSVPGYGRTADLGS